MHPVNPSSPQRDAQQGDAGPMLREQTLDAVEKLLVLHTEGGYSRGLYTSEQLGVIRQALKVDELADSDIARASDRFIASQSYAYAAPYCVPADYLGAIAVLLNDEETFGATDHNRNKNRGLVDAGAFEKALGNPETGYEKLVRGIFQRKTRVLEARRSAAAFSPYGPSISRCWTRNAVLTEGWELIGQRSYQV